MAFTSQDRSAQEHALQTPKRVHPTFRRTILSASSSRGNGDNPPSLVSSRSVPWLSPTSTASTVSPPTGFKDIWDAPETPSGKSSTASHSILTPLTPPTPSGSSKKLFFTPVSKLSFGVELDSVSKQQVSEKKDVTLQDNCFQPSKLFRNLTFELQAISQKNVVSSCVKYDINPSFVFIDDPISSRTRSKTGSKTTVTSAINTALGERKGNVKILSTPPLRTTFWKLLEQVMPHNLHGRLASEPGCCVASPVKNPSGQCTKSRKSLQDVGSILKKLVRCGTRKDYYGMLDHIEELVELIMCGMHRNTVLTQLKAGSRMAQLRSRLRDMTRMTELDRSIFTRWVDAICDLNGPVNPVPELQNVETSSKPAPQPKPIPKPVSETSPARTTVQVSSSSSFIPYQPEKSKKLSVFEAVYQKATAPLGVIARKPGFVYLFWDQEYFGMVKIGYTKDLSKRLESWNNQCDRKHVYHSSTECQVEIPHAHRVEQLVHAELKEYRKKRQCEGCGKTHIEWFDVGQAHVVKVLRKWREWILQEPYVQDERSGEWVIKPEMLGSLERMCEPLQQEVNIQKSSRKSGGHQRLPKKKKKGSRRTM